MATVVLVHGAWHGGWVWDGVAALLRAAGHTVMMPTMRGHQPGNDRTDVLFGDYINQVEELVRELDEVTLVGHSSAGMILQMVAPRVRLARLVFLNAFILPDGCCQFDLVPPAIAEQMTKAAKGRSDLSVPVDPGFVRGQLMAGETEEDTQRLLGRLVPQPLALFTTPVQTGGFRAEGLQKVVIHGKDDVSLPPGAYPGMARELGNHTLLEIEGGHETLFTHPERVASVLLRVLGV